MANTILINFAFILLTTVTYLILSTLHIYSAFPNPSGACQYNPPPISDFLFRVGGLHVYGIRALFMGVVVGGSILCAGPVVYILAFAHRREVSLNVAHADVGENTWQVGLANSHQTTKGAASLQSESLQDGPPQVRQNPGNVLPGWNRKRNCKLKKKRRRSPLLSRPPLASSVYPPSTLRCPSRMSVGIPRLGRAAEKLRPQRHSMQQARLALSLLQGESRERNMCIREPGKKSAGKDASNCQGGLLWGSAHARMTSIASSGYEIPSYYFGITGGQRMVAPFERDVVERWSSRIPSYHLEARDVEGRAMIESDSSISEVADSTWSL